MGTCETFIRSKWQRNYAFSRLKEKLSRNDSVRFKIRGKSQLDEC